MIEIRAKKDCVGCGACSEICPVKCISLYEDELGFLYPATDKDKCIGCNLCNKVCPVLNQDAPRHPLKVFAAKNPDDKVRMVSSSGGAFTAIATQVINDGGVVFGAKFDKEFNVVHDHTDCLEGLKDFQGSKYVQSRIGNSFTVASDFLKEGRKVLFSGTPCQNAALRLFLRKDYGSSLITVDMVCHGVPGPAVWRRHLLEIATRQKIHKNDITGVSFRDKRIGWRRFGLAVDSHAPFFQPLDENPYIQIFLKNFDLRPSCYYCPDKCGKSNSDITLADFWKLRKFHSDIFDEKGISLVLAYSPNGIEILKRAGLLLTPSSYENGLYGNPAIEESSSLPSGRSLFPLLFSSENHYSLQEILAILQE